MQNRSHLAVTAALSIAIVISAALLTSPGATAEAVKTTPHVFVPTTVAIEPSGREPAPTF